MPPAIRIRAANGRTFSINRLLTTVIVLLLCASVELAAARYGLAQDGSKTWNILYINSYHPGYSWSDDIQKGLIEAFQFPDSSVELSVEYLDSRRFSAPTLQNKLADILQTKYRGYRLDLVVVSDNSAFDFAIKYRELLFPEKPLVFCGYNNYRPEVLSGLTNISGVNEEVDVKSLIETARHIQPSLQTLAFVLSTGDASNKSIAEKMETTIIPGYLDQFEIVLLKDAPMALLRKTLARLPKESALFLMGQTSDMGHGRALTPMENGHLISAASPVPVYTLWDFHLNTGVLGGRILSGHDQGKAAGEMALRILKGTTAGSIPVIMTSPTRNIFDYTVLKRFNISPDSLPENSTVINKPYSFYEANKRAAGIILSVFAALVVFIIALSINIFMRIRAEKELQKHRDHLEIMVFERTAALTDSNKALSDSEERFRCLSDAAFEGIVFAVKGVIIEVNKTCCDMFGYHRSEVIDRTATDFIAAADRENVKSKIASGFEQPYLASGLKKDGTTFPIEIQGKVFSYRGRDVRVSAIRDLTRQKQAEEEIKTLRGILPICLFCKKIRDDKGYWEQVDIYIHKYSGADISHGICPECAKIHYPEQYEVIMKHKK